MTLKPKTHVEYSVEKRLTEEVDKIIRSSPKLLPLVDNITLAACFVSKVDDEGETYSRKGAVIKLKKVAPDFQAFMRVEAHFILVIDQHWWDKCHQKERNGSVLKYLTRIRIENTDDGVRTGLSGWDIEETFASLEASGPYNETNSRLASVTMTWKDRTLAMVASNIGKSAKETPANEEEEPEKPRVVARSIPKPVAKNSAKVEAPEPTRPPRKIPPDSAPKSKVEADPEPED